MEFGVFGVQTDQLRECCNGLVALAQVQIDVSLVDERRQMFRVEALGLVERFQGFVCAAEAAKRDAEHVQKIEILGVLLQADTN